MRHNFVLAAAVTALLAACGKAPPVQSPARRPAPPHRPATVIRPPVHAAPPKPVVQTAPGLEGVIGATREDLARQFGAARLDVWEGDARKLQFSGTACVLDVYLYPPAAGREPQATYVEARRASDGQDVDRAACVAALRKR